MFNITANLYIFSAIPYFTENKLSDPYEFVRYQTVYVYLNKEYLPRAFYVPNAKVLNRDDILAELKKSSFKPKELVLLEKNPNKSLTNKGNYKEAKIKFYSPNKLYIDINLDDPGFLVLSEIWYPGWKAFDNGKETEIFRGNYILRTIHLDKGNHEIKFIYKPIKFKIGLLISVITALAIIIYFITILKNNFY